MATEFGGVSSRSSRTGDVACERPADECVGVAVTHVVLGLQVAHDVHMLFEATARYDLLPFRDRAPIFLFDGRKIRSRSLLRPWRRLLVHFYVLLSLAAA